MRKGAKLTAARQLRREATLGESRLWEQLRNRSLGGCKFVRQAPVGPFIADFLCRQHCLIVEVDGATHSTETEVAHDLQRSTYLAKAGYRVVRFQNDEVLNGMDEVLTLILVELGG